MNPNRLPSAFILLAVIAVLSLPAVPAWAQAAPALGQIQALAAAKYDTVAAALAAAQRLGLAKIGLVGSEQFAP